MLPKAYAWHAWVFLHLPFAAAVGVFFDSTPLKSIEPHHEIGWVTGSNVKQQSRSFANTDPTGLRSVRQQQTSYMFIFSGATITLFNRVGGDVIAVVMVSGALA